VISVELLVIVLVMCILAEGFFSGSEIAVVSADRAVLRSKADGGDRGARMALAFLEHPQRLLATTLLGTSLAIVLATAVVTLFFLDGWQNGAVLGVLALAPALLIFGELVPKTLFQENADRWVTTLIYPLRLASIVFAPAVYILGRFTSFVTLTLKVEERRAQVTRDELRLLLEAAPEGGAAPAGDPRDEPEARIA
jgi:CBS domain containing-hemolysin-like protein